MSIDALIQRIDRLSTWPTEAGRLFHGRGGLFPGGEAWSLDAYPPVWLLTSHEAVDEAELAAIAQAITRAWDRLAVPEGERNWVLQQRDEVRAQNRVMAGSVPEPHLVNEAGLRFHLHLTQGLNHGFFLDMAEGRRWLREWLVARTGRGAGAGPRVLNLFAYTCAFSVVSRAAGAASVVNVDMAKGALAIGQRNHQANGLAEGVSFLPHDVFTSWGKLKRLGPYDLVVLDPPSYQKGSFVVEKDYARLLRRLPELLAPEGVALCCLNSPKLGSEFIAQHMVVEAPGLRRIARLAPAPGFEDALPARALKVEAWQMPGSADQAA
jgi:23S rRNA (cytosine1962-C5)-methyltransferase